MQHDNPASPITPSDICQLPGCDNLVEQPAGGGQRKRFCSDQHRVQFWRQSRAEGGETPAAAAAPKPPAATSPALVLRGQLEQSVQSLEAVLTRARTTLIELASLEEAEAIRAEATSSADEKVARAYNERAVEERRRRAAENLAEAASSAAQEAEEKMAQAQAEAERARAEVLQVRQETQEQIAQAHQLAEDRIRAAQLAAEAAVEESQQAKLGQAAAEAQVLRAREELEQVRAALRTASERARSSSVWKRKRTATGASWPPPIIWNGPRSAWSGPSPNCARKPRPAPRRKPMPGPSRVESRS